MRTIAHEYSNLRWQLQNNFYRWIAHRNEPLSLQTLRHAANDYLAAPPYRNVLSEDERPLDLLFFPLFRFGVVSFQDNGWYGLSPSCAVQLDKHCAVLINPFNEQRIETALCPGLYYGSPTELSITNLPHRTIDLTEAFQRLGSLEQRVLRGEAFRREKSTVSAHQIRCNGQWQNVENDQVLKNGWHLIRTENHAAAKRYLRINGVDFSIPHNNINPHGYTLASVLERIANTTDDWKPVEWTEQDDGLLRLSLRVRLFPVVLERLFLMGTLALGQLPETGSQQERHYFLAHEHAPALHRLFHLTTTSTYLS